MITWELGENGRRLGIRHGRRFVRHLYDTYGYPVAKHIRAPLAAVITYLVMKPLEWLFLLVLYLSDRKPEDRIARQYLPEMK